MTIKRRHFLSGLAATSLLPAFSAMTTAAGTKSGSNNANPTVTRSQSDNPPKIIKPKRWQAGDTVMLIAPASVEYEKLSLTLATESLEALGLKVKVAPHTMTRHGYFPANDQNRAKDINAAFSDDSIDGIVALRGGWGSARTLPYLDYDLIRDNPKALLGYSDITALLNGIFQKTGLVGFHGPTGGSAWGAFSTQNVREVMFEGKAQHMVNPADKGEYLTNRQNRIQTIVPGTAEGIVVGGNLTVLTSIQGTPYFPDMRGKLLILEDIGEDIYRVDRMLTQLALGGVFEQVTGVIFGGFTRVGSDGGMGAFALMDIFEQHMTRANLPSFYGAMFGHIKDKRTMAIGTRMKMDATDGTITMLESAVI